MLTALRANVRVSATGNAVAMGLPVAPQWEAQMPGAVGATGEKQSAQAKIQGLPRAWLNETDCSGMTDDY